MSHSESNAWPMTSHSDTLAVVIKELMRQVMGSRSSSKQSEPSFLSGTEICRVTLTLRLEKSTTERLCVIKHIFAVGGTTYTG